MPKRRRFWIAIAVVLAAVAVWLVAGRPGIRREPTYQGKALSLWFEDYYSQLSQSFYSHKGWDKAAEAVRGIGTNAIPTLLRMIQAKEPSPTTRKLLDLAGKQKWIGIRYRSSRRTHELADFAFKILGTNATCAVPELMRICADNRYPDSQEYAAYALYHVGPPANAAIPLLLHNFTHTNADVRLASVTAVLGIATDPKTFVSSAKIALKDPQPVIRSITVSALESRYRSGALGRSDALAAVPDLMEARQDKVFPPNQDLKFELENALWDLVPEQIAKPLVVEDATAIVANGVTTEALSREDYGELWTLIPKGKPVRCVCYQSVITPLYLYRGLTRTTNDHFLGRFDAVLPSSATNTTVEAVYIIDQHQILLCARSYDLKQFIELRRVE